MSVCLTVLLKSFSRRLHHICQTIWNELTDWLAIYWHKTLWFNRDKRYQINHVQTAADDDGDGSLRVSAWLLKRCVIHSFLGPQYLHMLLTNWPAIKPPVRLAYTKIFATNVCWDCHLLDDRQRRGDCDGPQYAIFNWRCPNKETIWFNNKNYLKSRLNTSLDKMLCCHLDIGDTQHMVNNANSAVCSGSLQL